MRVVRVTAASLMLIFSSAARAESIRDAVGRHLANELPEKSETSSDSDSFQSSSTDTASFDDGDGEETEIEDPPEKVERHAPTVAPLTTRRPSVLGRPAYLEVSWG